jgi:hypothetical protein
MPAFCVVECWLHPVAYSMIYLPLFVSVLFVGKKKERKEKKKENSTSF